MIRSFRDRDYVITPEVFIFAVIGNTHPVDRVIAYLKYIPDPQGKWGRDRQRFRRALEHYNVPSVLDSIRFLRANAPRYIFESNLDSITLSAVPIDRIDEHLRPEERLLQLRTSQHRDQLEDKALKLAEFISQNASVPVESMGVTGSLLARIHDPSFSDIDLVVYGRQHAFRVRDSLKNILKLSSGKVRGLAGASLENWITERVKSTPLTRQNAADLLSRKWNIGLFDGTEFSIHAVRTETETSERYGEKRHVPLGIVEATAKVTDDSESLFMPAVYSVRSATLGQNSSVHLADQIVSYEGLYAGVANRGETVAYRGKLERVESVSGIRYRIVVGSPEAQGTDYLLPLQLDP